MKRSKISKKWLGILAVVSLFASLFYSRRYNAQYPKPIQQIYTFLFEKPESWIVGTKEYFQNLSFNFKKNDQLSEQLQASEQKSAKYMAYSQLLESKIHELNKVLQLKKTTTNLSDHLFAKVLHQYRTFDVPLMRAQILNTPTNHEIDSRRVVVGADGLAGLVQRKGDQFFDFQNVNHASFRADVVLERTNERGIWKGTGNAHSNLILDNQNDIKIGDIILTSGLENKFPSLVPIGFVKHLEYSSSGLANSIKVQSLVNFKTLRFVYLTSQQLVVSQNAR